ncbi:ATP-dependent DNA helicase [Abeliophyllum distichum]|uniref:ATP-dependent DNA helicase n=1 Tax=Abeliophyllum distichum TaxID=126358 RepID=A0ABD1QXY4_9LAMI
MAPTGVAAFNIGGATIHHELAISAERKLSQPYTHISGDQCRRMQEDFKDTKLIIIDEYSMLGRAMIANVDLRCRYIFANNEAFGGVSVVLVGDIRQLPPVFDSPLYLVSKNNCETATKSEPDQAKGLEKLLYISVGARVMLRANLATHNGLVNGAMGTVVDIVYAVNCKSPCDLPLAIIVDFDNYRGTSFREGTNLIPIPPITSNWKASNVFTEGTKVVAVDEWPPTTFFRVSAPICHVLLFTGLGLVTARRRGHPEQDYGDMEIEEFPDEFQCCVCLPQLIVLGLPLHSAWRSGHHRS